MGKLSELSFLSKTFICPSDDISELRIVRDVIKVLNRSLAYTKRDARFINNPGLYVLALYIALKREKLSRLLEIILCYRLDRFINNLMLLDRDYIIDVLRNEEHVQYSFGGIENAY